MRRASKSPNSKISTTRERSPIGISNNNNNNSTSPSSSSSRVKSDKVRIIVRIRPVLFDEEPNEYLTLQDSTTIKIIRPDFNTIIMKFDEIIDQDGQQSEVFNMIRDAVHYFIQGNNYTIFAYGQTGAGKTYTVIGDYTEASKNTERILDYLKGENRGLLPRTLESVFSILNQQKRTATKLYISFYEVYNDKIYDLLNPKEAHKQSGLELRENRLGGNQILDLSSFEIKTIDHAFECLKVGLRNRMTGSTHANAQSSRSHSIFQIDLTQLDPVTNKIITSKLRIVDLAGSEKFIIPKNISPEEREIRIQELTSINGSLSALGHCISALIEPKRTHIPFRNSKLTRVLSDSLGGNGKVCFIVCISPSTESGTETFSTLQFANRAKKVVLDGKHLKKEKVKEAASVLTKYSQLIDVLKTYCKDPKFTSQLGSIFSNKKFQELEEEIKNLKRQNEELKNEIGEIKRSCSPFAGSSETNLNHTLVKPGTFSQNSLFSVLNTKTTCRSAGKESDNASGGNFTPRMYSGAESTASMSNNSDSSRGHLRKSPTIHHKKDTYSEDCYDQVLSYEGMSISKSIPTSSYRNGNDDNNNKENRDKRKPTPQGRSNKFWEVNDNDDEEQVVTKSNGNKLEEKYTSFGKSNSRNKKENSNALLLQQMRQKEIEAKYKAFFSCNTEDVSPSKKQNISLSDKNKELVNSLFKRIKSPKMITKAQDKDQDKDNEGSILFNIARQIENTNTNSSNGSSILGDYHLGKPYTEVYQTISSDNNNNSQSKENEGVYDISSPNDDYLILETHNQQHHQHKSRNQQQSQYEHYLDNQYYQGQQQNQHHHHQQQQGNTNLSGFFANSDLSMILPDNQYKTSNNIITADNSSDNMNSTILSDRSNKESMVINNENKRDFIMQSNSFIKEDSHESSKASSLTKIYHSNNKSNGSNRGNDGGSSACDSSNRGSGRGVDVNVHSNTSREQYSYRGDELIQSLDRKLGKVHEFNAQHDHLLKNLDQKLADFQQKSIKELVYYSIVKNESDSENSYSKVDAASFENLITSPQHFVTIISDLKKEVTSALDMVKKLQDVDEETENNSHDLFEIKPKEVKAINQDKEKELIQRTLKQRDINASSSNANTHGKNQKSKEIGKSSFDIMKQHMPSLFMNNVKGQ